MAVGDARPYRLECWEFNLDTIEEEWRMWSTYVNETSAMERRDKLIRKGHKARVVYPETGAVSRLPEPDKTCELCGVLHPGPFDGTCLI